MLHTPSSLHSDAAIRVLTKSADGAAGCARASGVIVLVHAARSEGGVCSASKPKVASGSDGNDTNAVRRCLFAVQILPSIEPSLTVCLRSYAPAMRRRVAALSSTQPSVHVGSKQQ